MVIAASALCNLSDKKALCIRLSSPVCFRLHAAKPQSCENRDKSPDQLIQSQLLCELAVRNWLVIPVVLSGNDQAASLSLWQGLIAVRLAL